MIQSVKVKNLTLSKDNVRKSNRDAGIDTLAANIAAQGLLQNLIVTPLKKAGMFTVKAGGRRLRALQLLIQQGTLPATTAPRTALPCRPSSYSRPAPTTPPRSPMRQAIMPRSELCRMAWPGGGVPRGSHAAVGIIRKVGVLGEGRRLLQDRPSAQALMPKNGYSGDCDGKCFRSAWAMVEERTSLTALKLELERALVIVDELGETRIGAFIDMALSAVIERIEGNEQP